MARIMTKFRAITIFICMNLYFKWTILQAACEEEQKGEFIHETNGVSYLIWHKDKLPWPEALKFCAARNMSLVSFDSQYKLIQFNIFLLKHNFIDRPHTGNDYIYWTSGNDLQQEGTFIWESTGAPLTFNHWLTGMPDNYRGDEHCVEMGLRLLGRWNDNRCWYRRHFICERNITTTLT